MLIRSEFDIQFQLPFPSPMIAVLHLHPSVEPRLRAGNHLLIEQLVSADPADNVVIPHTTYLDVFGNRCSRFVAPSGHLRLSGTNTIDAIDHPDTQYPNALSPNIEDLPNEALQYLLPSRYCEVDRFGAIAQDLFGATKPGWERAAAIRDWVHEKVTFNYNAARPTKTAMDVLVERTGVCRDFQHLAITLSRSMNIPARYVTGYIGDIRRPYGGPGDFSAWYQVYLDNQWIDLDARHNYPRLGRILMALGRDAADVALTTSFGSAPLTYFLVESNEIDAAGNKVPLPTSTPDTPPATATATPEPNTPTQTNPTTASPSQTQSATT